MSLPVALLVHADGTTEPLSRDEACGRYIMRQAVCGECKQKHGPLRKYEGAFACNGNTLVSGRRPPDAWGETNAGTLLYYEVRP